MQYWSTYLDSERSSENIKRPEIVEFALRGQLNAILDTPRTPRFENAACDGVDIDVFYSDAPADIAKAKSFCAECPLLQECSTWAVNYVNFGLMGGMTPKERFIKRGGKDAIELDDIQMLKEQFKFIMSQPASKVALHFEVETRTVIRWRNILRPYALAA